MGRSGDAARAAAAQRLISTTITGLRAPLSLIYFHFLLLPSLIAQGDERPALCSRLRTQAGLCHSLHRDGTARLLGMRLPGRQGRGWREQHSPQLPECAWSTLSVRGLVRPARHLWFHLTLPSDLPFDLPALWRTLLRVGDVFLAGSAHPDAKLGHHSGRGERRTVIVSTGRWEEGLVQLQWHRLV